VLAGPWRQGQEEVAFHPQAAGFEPRLHDLVGGRRIRRRLEDDELSPRQTLGDRVDGADHEREIRIFRLAQRRRHAHVDHVEACQRRRVGRGAPPRAGHGVGEVRRVHIGDVTAARVDLADLARIHVEARDVESCARQLDGERQSHVPEPNHADARASIAEAGEQCHEPAVGVRHAYPNR
jgi:hypothetical protein